MFKVSAHTSPALQKRLDDLSDPKIRPLLKQVQDIVEEDNKRGILAGEDKDGRPLKPVVRPGGPPLAPHGPSSRVVENFDAVGSGGSGKTGQVKGTWKDVDY